jgi:hypothetical protein
VDTQLPHEAIQQLKGLVLQLHVCKGVSAKYEATYHRETNNVLFNVRERTHVDFTSDLVFLQLIRPGPLSDLIAAYAPSGDRIKTNRTASTKSRCRWV